MRVFVTGAGGWVGSAVVEELLGEGHDVIGLVRSESSAALLESTGATALRGDLDDLDSLRRGAEVADAVIHLANKHDWANPAATNLTERTAVQTLGDVLAGSGRAFLAASAVASIVASGAAIEDDASPAVGLNSMRGGSENLALSFAAQGVRAMVVRLAPSVHGRGDNRGFVGGLVRAARAAGMSGFIDDGTNTWSAVHRSDAAALIRLGIENASAGTRLHAIAEESITTRAIAEAIASKYGLVTASIPATDALTHFGPVGRFFALDIRANSLQTRDRLNWSPHAPTLSDDIAAGAYDAA
ncbi:nucleoside-diphosphate-sugar epimerase [Rhodococcus sp. 27YEA15]|uniref:SDR family oxidoreductase n=1 Tax=Rhodococcus sp. 27YEA15 TaxID=3156259 RepID=UPI003C7A5CFA